MVTCQHDSGSATGCRPLCDAPASHVVTYQNGSAGPFRSEVCASHVAVTEARVFPGHIQTVPIGHVPAGNVNYCHGSGSYLVTTRGGRVSGEAPGWDVLADDLTRRHGYVIGAPRVTDLPGCAERVTTAELFELDWSLCPA